MNEGWRERLIIAPHVAFVVVAALAMGGVLYGASGRLIFPIDDAYINVGLGRRFFDGTARGEFPSGTTAFGWSLLFGALASLIGRWVIVVVFVANVVGGLWAISLLARLLPQRGRSLPDMLFLLWAVFFINLPFLAVLGMEHLWDAAFVIAALAAMARLIEGGKDRDGLQLAAFVFLAGLCRQETIALGLAIAVVLAAHRFYRWAALVLVAEALPILAQGALQLLQGKSFTANPVAIKADVGETAYQVAAHIYGRLIYLTVPMDVSLCIGAATIVLFILLILPTSGRVAAARALAVTTLVYTFGHLAFGGTGWLGRYQTPIVASAAAMLAIALPDLGRAWTATTNRLLYIPALLFGVAWTAVDNERFDSLVHLPAISREVADQMCRISDVVGQAPKDEPVILNDVGCTTFFRDNPIVDLFGLTAHDVRALGGMHGLKRGDIEALARRRGAKMAVVYKSWFEERIPDDWVEVGSWTTPTNKYAADRTITIYATRAEWRDEVANRWRAYVRNAGKLNGVQFDG
jgi:hypothetical protein